MNIFTFCAFDRRPDEESKKSRPHKNFFFFLLDEKESRKIDAGHPQGSATRQSFRPPHRMLAKGFLILNGGSESSQCSDIDRVKYSDGKQPKYSNYFIPQTNMLSRFL